MERTWEVRQDQIFYLQPYYHYKLWIISQILLSQIACSFWLIYTHQFLTLINGSTLRMKDNRKKFAQGIEDCEDFNGELYDPFSKPSIGPSYKNARVVDRMKCCVALFEDSDEQTENTDDFYDHQGPAQKQVELNVMKQINFNTPNQRPPTKQTNKIDGIQIKGSILDKIIANKNKTRTFQQPSLKQNYQKYEQFGFNNNFRVAYPQTPGFKNLLSSPFGKFNSLFKDTIFTLSKDLQFPQSRLTNCEPLELSANPLNFYNKSKQTFDTGRYLLGLSLKFKQNGQMAEAFYFCCLACYADPFYSLAWRKYVSLLEQNGKLSKACAIAKTGFLFTQNEDLVKSYITNGEKCGVELHKLQGIMCSLSKPEQFEKTLLPQSAKLQIKYGKTWKGVKVLWEICKVNDFKLSVCIITLFLARFLQNLGCPDQAMSLLKQSFAKSMSKLQVYLLYLEISIRKNKCLVQTDLQEILKYLDYISGQNRYRLFLSIAQIFFKNNDQRYYMYIGSAYRAAVDYCAPGAGCSKALKQIYYTIANLHKVCPNVKNIKSDNTIFQLNRYRFINGQPLFEYQFEDWKYYLHYGVVKRHDLLAIAAKKYSLTGRIIAEWIHCLRLVRRPLEMLKIWRDKIDQVPKSGQLWCEGGRIYAQLGEFSNAEKCFRCAMHFTPQYGDSFIEELRLLLRDSRFLQIYKLKKLFLVSEPFYGHVLSYSKLNHWQPYSLTLNEVWQNASYEISQDLYRPKQPQQRLFTAYRPYNEAYAHQSSKQQRQKLFISYEQMENKN